MNTEFSITATVRRLPIQKRIATAPAVVAALADATKVHADFGQLHHELADLLFPAEASRGVIALIQECDDPAELVRLRSRHAELNGPGAEAAQGQARGMILEKWRTVNTAMVHLLDAAEAALADLRSEAEVAEAALFAGFAMGRERTGVSKRLDSVAQEFAGFRGSLKQLSERTFILPPSTGQHILDWFVR